MKDYDYHSLFYYQVLSRLQRYRGAGGGTLQAPKNLESGITIRVGYEPVTQSYPHHYLRDDFVARRDKYVVASKGGENFVIMRVAREAEEAVVYRKGLRAVFPKDYAVAKRELETLMSKFYELTWEQYAPATRVDLSDEPGLPNHINVDRSIRKNL